MKYYNFSLLKDYNQMQEKRTEAVFGLDLMNYEPLLKDRNLRVMVEWWIDNPEEKRVVQLFRDANFPNKTRYVLRIPYDEIRDTIYLFRVLVVNQSNKTVEKSAINTIRPAIEGIIPPDTEEEAKKLGGYEYVQGLLNMIAQMQNQVTEVLDRAEILETDIEGVIRDWAAHADLDTEIYELINERIEYKTAVTKEELIDDY